MKRRLTVLVGTLVCALALAASAPADVCACGGGGPPWCITQMNGALYCYDPGRGWFYP